MRSRGQRRSGKGVVLLEHTALRPVIMDAAAEIAKLNAIAAIAEESRFLAPGAKKAVEQTMIETERMALDRNSQDVFQRAVCRRPDGELALAVLLAREAGTALASIHETLLHPSATLRAEEVVLHGDFGFSNLFLTFDQRLVVLDPFPVSPVNELIWDYGPREQDLAMFVSCLMGRVRARSLLRIRAARAAQLVREFVDAYNQVSTFPADQTVAIELSVELTLSYFKQGSLIKRTAGQAMWQVNKHRVNAQLRKVLG